MGNVSRHAGTVGQTTNLCALGQQLVDRDLGGFIREPEMWHRFKGRLALAMQLLRAAEEPCQNVAKSRGALAAVKGEEDGFRQLRGHQNGEEACTANVGSNVFFW